MKKIYLSGYVGDELTSWRVKEALDAAGGDEIEVHLNTMGGSIVEGIAIYDLFDKYEGKKTLLMGGLVASIGSYIATAFPKVIAQDITVYMIHNAHDFAYGDHNAFLEEANKLEKMSAHIADRLARFSGKDKKDVVELMNNESWYYGKDILDAGFATEFLETGKAKDVGENALEVEKFKYYEKLKSVAVFRGELSQKEQREEKMNKKEFIEKAKGLIKDGELTFEDAVNLFEANDQLITEAQRATLTALGDDDPVELRAKADAAEKAALNAQLDEHFGKEGTLRTYAQGCVERGMSIEDIQKDPVAIDLAAKRADGSLNVVVVDPVEDKNKKIEDGDKIIVNY